MKSVVRFFIIVLCIISCCTVMSAQQLPTGLHPLWYAVVEWQDSTFLIFKLYLEDDGSATMIDENGLTTDGHWSFENNTSWIKMNLGSATYSFTFTDDKLSGSARTASLPGRFEAWNEKNASFNARKTKAMKSRRGIARITTEYGDIRSQTREQGTIGIGRVASPGKISFNFEFLTLSAIKINDTVHYSKNWLMSGTGLLLLGIIGMDAEGKIPDWSAIFLVPQVLLNWDVSIPLGTRYLCADVAQRTDFFVVNGKGDTFATSSVGLQIDGAGTSLPFQIRALYCIPWVKDWLRGRKNYVSVGLNLVL